MSAVVADTHTIIWYLRSPDKLSTKINNFEIVAIAISALLV
jgi:PIN domain nuclease of toxin-antitoxin system